MKQTGRRQTIRLLYKKRLDRLPSSGDAFATTCLYLKLYIPQTLAFYSRLKMADWEDLNTNNNGNKDSCQRNLHMSCEIAKILLSKCIRVIVKFMKRLPD